MAPGCRKPRRVALGIIVMDETEIELGLRLQMQIVERGEIGIIGAPLGNRHVKELDRAHDAGAGRIGNLDLIVMSLGWTQCSSAGLP